MTLDIDDAAARRAQIVDKLRAETGVDEKVIETLIRAFYTRVRADDLIGPVFAARIDDWEPHLQKMFAFWSSLMLMTGAYHGQPMRLHAPLPIDGAHFDRWLRLFEETAHDICPPGAASLFIERARRVAESLELGVAVSNGALLGKGERYKRSA
ncbi:group III truncated hemoglobin [Methylocella silvestris]|uniref:Preprotein translocase subunit TatC n=1 Tax=Methylocella silvestris TaxID=199596 RepID=A0A2J7TL00_METSI|nr:group III truncated hemoglobin [Methylocella silvestris]PNG27440.1 preprotein translocase subunit TatC [Methylocella silvestris]